MLFYNIQRFIPAVLHQFEAKSYDNLRRIWI
ncbi:hypothetical protein EV213_101151 [Aureibacillus halotolerans]|uniref:Uncharacterized protein n=1 Tax=Aureibacillus halotolerans TaxID=1508390 RepID=A0A4R6UA53_9BACI|nr:hypothetical protein EV213_101151 [Aureibacillus halotolerans]